MLVVVRKVPARLVLTALLPDVRSPVVVPLCGLLLP